MYKKLILELLVTIYGSVIDIVEMLRALVNIACYTGSIFKQNTV